MVACRQHKAVKHKEHKNIWVRWHADYYIYIYIYIYIYMKIIPVFSWRSSTFAGCCFSRYEEFLVVWSKDLHPSLNIPRGNYWDKCWSEMGLSLMMTGGKWYCAVSCSILKHQIFVTVDIKSIFWFNICYSKLYTKSCPLPRPTQNVLYKAPFFV